MNNTMHDFTAETMDLIRLGPSPAMHAATTMNAAIPNNEYFTAISKRPMQSRRTNTAGDAHFT